MLEVWTYNLFSKQERPCPVLERVDSLQVRRQPGCSKTRVELPAKKLKPGRTAFLEEPLWHALSHPVVYGQEGAELQPETRHEQGLTLSL